MNKLTTSGSTISKEVFVNRVLPREVAQAVQGSSDTRFYGVGSGDVGKELPRNKSVLYTVCTVDLESNPYHAELATTTTDLQLHRCTTSPPRPLQPMRTTFGILLAEQAPGRTHRECGSVCESFCSLFSHVVLALLS